MRVVKTASIVIFLAMNLMAARGAAAERPLTKDDLTLLLVGGASSEKLVGLIEQRGIDFEMNPGLVKKFRELGADDAVIQALLKAAEQRKPPSPAALPEAEPGETVTPAPELPRHPASAEASARPVAPGFSITDISGKRLSLADYRGKVVLLNFWATWCSRCRAAIPHFVALQDRYRDQGLQVIGLSVDQDVSTVREYCQRNPLNYPVGMSDAAVRQAYGGVPGIPMTFLIGRDGRVYGERVGIPQDGNVTDFFESDLKTLLAAPPPVGMAAATPALPSSETKESAASAAKAASSAQHLPATPAKPASASEAAPPVPPAKTHALAEPSPAEIERIIQQFAAKEKLFKEARNNYTYHQINKVQELDVDGNVTGTFQQEWDILFDDKGGRIERVTYAPLDTLKRIGITQEDLNAMRKIQPFVLTSDELPDYDVKYLGHVKLDELTTYVFSVRPKEIEKGRLYFQGTVWVDDRDLQIVKSEGKTVPEQRPKKGQENLFPRFTTYREQVDGKYWFPTFTMADDTLYFSSGPVRVRQVIRYTDYKQYKATTRIIAIGPEEKPAVNSQTTSSKPK